MLLANICIFCVKNLVSPITAKYGYLQLPQNMVSPITTKSKTILEQKIAKARCLLLVP